MMRAKGKPSTGVGRFALYGFALEKDQSLRDTA